MPDSAGEALLVLLAAAGVVALLSRLFFAIARWALRAAEVTAASSTAEANARRGDLTGLADARAVESRARDARRRAGFLAAVWFLSLSIPFALESFGAYALAAPLWLIPDRRQ
jgi:hypothetical protein